MASAPANGTTRKRGAEPPTDWNSAISIGTSRRVERNDRVTPPARRSAVTERRPRC